MFALMAMWDAIGTILEVAANQRWCVFQLDIKSAFMHGELAEDIYISQPVEYHKGSPEMTYKLRKSLYGLRQDPRA